MIMLRSAAEKSKFHEWLMKWKASLYVDINVNIVFLKKHSKKWYHLCKI